MVTEISFLCFLFHLGFVEIIIGRYFFFKCRELKDELILLLRGCNWEYKNMSLHQKFFPSVS